MVTETDDPEMVTETGDPEMVTGNGDPEMVTNAKEGAGILTEDKEEMTELAVERKETGKMAEKTETREKGRAPETEKTRGNEIIKKTLTKIVPARSQNARKLPQRKAWVGFCPNFLASKTSFGPQNEVIHAHSGSI